MSRNRYIGDYITWRYLYRGGSYACLKSYFDMCFRNRPGYYRIISQELVESEVEIVNMIL